MRKSFTLKIGGEAGFGIMTTGLIFSKTVARSGFHVFDYVEYPSLIRGGHNVMETHFSTDEVYTQEKGVDLLVALNKDTVDLHKEELKENGGIMYDPDQVVIDPEQFSGKKIVLFPVPFKKLLAEIGALKLMENNMAVGAAAALFGLPFENLAGVISDIFGGKKGEQIVKENRQAAEHGYNYIVNNKMVLHVSSDSKSTKLNVRESLVLTGNEAVGMGAIAAKCKFYAAYPMSPSSSLLHYVASKASQTGMVVRHAEDEIGVINEVIGASFGGVRSMLGTSGGGFSLMTEGVSFAGISENPLVIFIAQRPGPATGLPTWTEQGDLQFVIRSGHGEFPKIVLAPGDVEEAYSLTIEAFNLADIYQTPVFILSDKWLAESHKSFSVTDFHTRSSVTLDRGKWATIQPGAEIQNFPRYKVTDDGISPRLVPGTKGAYYQSNSYEHLEDGHTTEDAKVRIQQVDKRSRKMSTYLSKHFQSPKWYGMENADITLVAWGTVKSPIMDLFVREGTTINGKTVNLIHFTHMWPLDDKKIEMELKKAKQLVLVENNSTGQLGQLIRQETGILIEKRFLKYDGRPIYAEEIKEFLLKV